MNARELRRWRRGATIALLVAMAVHGYVSLQMFYRVGPGLTLLFLLTTSMLALVYGEFREIWRANPVGNTHNEVGS